MRHRGATLVEYALILVAVILIAIGAFKVLGKKVGARGERAADVVSGEHRDAHPGLARDPRAKGDDDLTDGFAPKR